MSHVDSGMVIKDIEALATVVKAQCPDLEIVKQKTFKTVTTTLEKMTKFYPAEQYHQDFVEKNPYHPYVTSVSKPRKLNFLKKLKNP